MLHIGVKEKPGIWMFLLLVVWTLVSCKPGETEHQEEEEIYLADYESPDHLWGYMDTTGRLVIPPDFDDAGFFSEGFAAVNQSGRWGYIDHSGSIQIKPVYKSAWAFHEGMARVTPFSGHDHFITSKGRVISSTEWSAAADFSDGLAKVQVGNTFGFVDTSGQLVIRPAYSRCWNFENGVAIISTDEMAGVIDKKGNEILPQQFNTIKRIDKTGLLLANKNNDAFIYDVKGHELHHFPGVKGIESDGKVLSVRKENLVFLVDIDEEKVLPGGGWKNLIYLGEERWAARQDTSFLLIDSDGKKVNQKPFTQINKFVDGYAAYYTGSQWGYIDVNGKDLTPDVFGLAWDYKDGYARAAFSEGIAFINRDLKLAFYPPPGTMEMRDFSEGLAPIQIRHH